MSHTFVARHYAPRANDYVNSHVHRHGADLKAIERLASDRRFGRALDLGCGGGHVAYCLAPHVDAVVASDITPDMLDAVAQEAAMRGLSNITTVCAPAEKLPFDDCTFDAVFCRFTAHHWDDPVAGLREAYRVLAPDGIAMFIDVTAPALPAADTWLQTLELLRDVSHGRDYTCAEWERMLEAAGFSVAEKGSHPLRMEFSSWVARTKTPLLHIEAIRALQQSAPDTVNDLLGIEPDGSFTLDVSSFVVTR